MITITHLLTHLSCSYTAHLVSNHLTSRNDIPVSLHIQISYSSTLQISKQTENSLTPSAYPNTSKNSLHHTYPSIFTKVITKTTISLIKFLHQNKRKLFMQQQTPKTQITIYFTRNSERKINSSTKTIQQLFHIHTLFNKLLKNKILTHWKVKLPAKS